MPMPIPSKVVLILAAASIFPAGVSASASPITYTEQITASGTLGGVGFSNANVVLTMNNDTTNVMGEENAGTATVTIGAGPAVTFTNPITFAVAPLGAGLELGPVVLFQDDVVDFIIVADANPAFAAYDLKSAIGPLTGPDAIFEVSFPTSGGNLMFTGGGPDSIFTATVPTTVPEPRCWALIAAGVAGLCLMRQRSKIRFRAAANQT
ncbi:MAG: hypothetical protein WB611_06000 [Stellaceae bacterium]